MAPCKRSAARSLASCIPAALSALIFASLVVGQPSRCGTECQLLSWRTVMPALSTSLLLTIDVIVWPTRGLAARVSVAIARF